ncbi:MAG: hypothetical protein GKR93_13640 [Gammaproteobacteria bacterium]|nr:hypothetical protein [Gammaproteobacteria bacterium]
MEEIKVHLTEEEFQRLNELFPPSEKSATVGRRAVEIVKYHFLSINSDYKFSKASKGADLKVVCGDFDFEIEIKGTTKADIAWSQLKVSSQTSHDRLFQGLPLYRVISANNIHPTIFVLKHDDDFILSPETRWKIQRKN